MNIFIDIDGTLTQDGEHENGEPNVDMVKKAKLLCKQHYVVIWSARGEQYVKSFCNKYKIIPNKMISKPDIIIDDNPTIRPKTSMKIISPNEGLSL